MVDLFLFGGYLESYFERRCQTGSHKIDHTDLISPCRELFMRSLGFVVALPIRWQIVFHVRLSTGDPI